MMLEVKGNLIKNRYVLLLGSNVGDRKRYIADARKLIEKEIGPISTLSLVYETDAWGGITQGVFLNQVLIVFSDAIPTQLIQIIMNIEQKLGRTRKERWDSRTIDIDVLYCNEEIITTENLVVPHPELQNRRFTLVPLSEIDPDFIHPVFHQTNKQLLEICTDLLQVKVLNE